MSLLWNEFRIYLVHKLWQVPEKWHKHCQLNQCVIYIKNAKLIQSDHRDSQIDTPVSKYCRKLDLN